MADKQTTSQRIDWIEPQVRELAVAETSLTRVPAATVKRPGPIARFRKRFRRK